MICLAGANSYGHPAIQSIKSRITDSAPVSLVDRISRHCILTAREVCDHSSATFNNMTKERLARHGTISAVQLFQRKCALRFDSKLLTSSFTRIGVAGE